MGARELLIDRMMDERRTLTSVTDRLLVGIGLAALFGTDDHD